MSTSPAIRKTPAVSSVAGGLTLAMIAFTACTPASPSSTVTTSSTAVSPARSADSADFSGLVDIGGRRIYLQCTGSGSPTVFLISGNPIAADLWDSPLGKQPTTYQSVAKSTRVCAYDRPGTTRAVEGGGDSRSDTVPQPSTPTDSVDDLHALIRASGESTPVVLAGHSYGGAIARLYAHTYPDDVAGLVMVDAFTPELRTNLGAEAWSLWKQQNATKPEVLKDYPEVERFDFDQASDILAAGGSIGDIPLVVLTADAPIHDVPVVGLRDISAATQEAHRRAQDQVAGLAPGAIHVTNTNSGHNMMLDNPAIVTEAIDDVVTAVRDGRSTASALSAATGELTGLVDIGAGRQMFVECRGVGSPTVVLMAGKGNGAADWSQILSPEDPAHQAAGDDLPLGGELVASDEAVLPRVAELTRVCAYDRPDVRFDGAVTTPREQPHTVDADVADLDALLTAIGETGPKVLVAHSYSGVIALLYARTHPGEVAGLVMDDALTEDLADVADGDRLKYWDKTNAATSEQVREGVQVLDAFDQIDAAQPLPKVPTVVLVADKPWRTDLLPADVRNRGITFAEWVAQLKHFAKRTGAELVTETSSGHDIHLYNAGLVVDAISSVVDDVREDGPLDAASVDRVESAFKEGFARSGAAGATIGVWIPGRGSYVASLGVADRATGEPMRPDMQAPIGSVTKVYTGQLALEMVSEGELSLDDRISRWYPKYPKADEITLAMLMNHSSGISDISEQQIEIKCSDPLRTVRPDELIEISARSPRADFEPGTGSQYSSANTIILGRILEKVTGKSYGRLLEERIFTPLGIHRTQLDTAGRLEAPYAHGYTDMCAPAGEKGSDTSSWTMLAFSAGALASTIDDLHTFGTAFGEGLGLSDQMLRARISDTSPGDDASGLGLVVERDPKFDSVVSIGHAGSEPGYGANLLYFPCSGAVFAAMVNADFAPAMPEILRAVQPVVRELAEAECVT